MKTTISVPKDKWLKFGTTVVERTKDTNKNAVILKLIDGYIDGKLKV